MDIGAVRADVPAVSQTGVRLKRGAAAWHILLTFNFYLLICAICD